MEVALKNPEVSIQRSLIGRKLGRYEILAKIASGGMASVYVARAQGVAGFERLTAIKVLHANLAHEEDFVKMFLDEARLAARIRHPNVVATLDISDTLDAGYYLVMEYIEGDHLGKLLSGTTKAGVRLDLPVILRIITDVLGGLSAAHNLADENGKKLNLVHRDISPHNIMVGIDGIARLTDFGIAKAEDRLSHTRDGQIKGKLGYMAPEHASKGVSDARSDLFSVGIILWECLTYKRLFRADSAAESLRKLLLEPIPLPSSIKKEYEPFDEILGKALSREPDERFQSADEFCEVLEAAAANCGGTASLRKVGQIVQRYAATRIEREKALIKESLNTIRTTSEQRYDVPQSSDDPVSEPSIRSASKSSAVFRSSPSASAASLRSGVRPLSSQPESVDDSSSGDRYFRDQASVLSSIVESAPGVSTRTKWFVTIAVVWCAALAALAFYTMRENKPKPFKVIEMSPLQEPKETTHAKPSATVSESEKVMLETRVEPKSQTSSEGSNSIDPLKGPSTNRVGSAIENERDTKQPEKISSKAAASENKKEDVREKIVESKTTKRRPTVRKHAVKKPLRQSKSAKEKPKSVSKDIPADELPPFNPYLNTK